LWSPASRADTTKVAADTFVNAAAPAQNNGSDPTISVRNTGAGGIRQGYLLFDLSTLAPSLRASRATLRLWVADVEDAGSIEVRLASGAWQEPTLTAANAPAPGALVGTRTIALANRRSFVTVEITSTVADWLSGVAVNNGLVIVPSSADRIRVEFDTKENTGTSHPAEIEIASAADITSVTAGSGLSGGGASGDVTVGLRTDCPVGTLLQWNGAGWICVPLPAGGGTVTEVNSGVGLKGGPITGSGTLSLDTAYTDRRYLPWGLGAFRIDVTVDCDKGESLQIPLDEAPIYGHYYVIVLGTCKEQPSPYYLPFRPMDTHIVAGSPGATIESPTDGGVAVIVAGPGWLEITGLTLKGSVEAGSGALVEVVSSRVTGARKAGINVKNGTLSLRGSTVDGNGGAGVFASDSSTVFMEDSTIEHNAGEGIAVWTNSAAIVSHGTRISDNAGYGLALFFGSKADVGAATIENNRTGIHAQGGAGVLLRGSPWGSSVIEANTVGIDLLDTSLALAFGAGAASISGSSVMGIRCAPPPGTAQLAGVLSSVVFGGNTQDTNCPGN
jgi:hypothetical protein